MSSHLGLLRHCAARVSRSLLVLSTLPLIAAAPMRAQSYLLPGVISTVAGSATPTLFTDGGAALSTQVFPNSIALDSSGNVYVADPNYCVIHRVDATTGLITVAAGTQGTCGNGTDGLLATATHLSGPQGVALDPAGNLYIADSGNGFVRKVDANTHLATIVAGNGIGVPLSSGPAIASPLQYPVGVAVNTAGDLYISQNFVVSRVDHVSGQISTFAGTPGSIGYSGDGSLATAATLTLPFQLALDNAGDLYIADYGANVVREVTVDGKIHTVAGNGTAGYSGDGGLATSAKLNQPYGVVVDGFGNLYIADSANNVIREVSSSGIISTVAGTGAAGFSGDGGPALYAWLNLPKGLALDSHGDLYLADFSNQRVRVIQATAAGFKTPPQISTGLIDFGTQPANSTSNFWTVTIANTVGTPLNLWSIFLSDPVNFTMTTNCGSVLNAYSSCNVQVSFSPSAATGYTGLLYVISDASHSPQSLTMIGTGTSSAPTALVSLDNIDFGTQTVGTTSNSWTVTLNNTSGSLMTLNSVTLSDPTNFSLQNNCGPVLGAHSTCTVQISFTPQSAITFTGTVTFSDNASTGGGTQTVHLTGTGTAANTTIFLAPSAVDFGNQTVGTTSNAWTVTVNNESGSSIPLTGIILSDTTNFQLTNNCSTMLAPHSTCNLLIAFSPQAGTLYNASITVQPVSGVPQQVFLSGNGSVVTPALLVAPGSIGFGTQQVHSTSNPWTVTISNTSDVSVALTGILSTDPDFSETDNCGTSIAAHTTCNMQVAFTPLFPTSFSGQIVIQTTSYGSYVLPLSGQGISTPNSVLVSPTTIAFGNQQVNSTSNSWTITVSNTANTPVTFLQAFSTPFFPLVNNCGTTLAAYSTCTMQVSFQPPAPVSFTGAIFILTQDGLGDPPQPFTINLSGTGTSTPNAVTVSPQTIDFGNQPQFTTSNAWTVTINNTSNQPQTVLALQPVTPFFNIGNSTCGSQLPANSTCTIQVSFTPQVLATVTGQIVVATADTLLDPEQVQFINLTGTGTNPNVAAILSPSSVDFGSVNLGVTSNSWTINLSNPNGTPVLFSTPPTIVGPNVFNQTNNCGLGLAPYSSCSFTVMFTPVNTPGVFSGALIVPVQYTTVGGLVTSTGVLQTTLTGTGVMPAQGVFFSPTNIDFGSLTTGQGGNPWTVTLNNTSSYPVNLGSFSLTDNSDFTLGNNTCSTTLSANTTCTLQLSFTPHATGTINGALNLIVSSVGYSDITTQTITLTGKGSPLPDYSLTVTPQVLTLTAGQAGTATFTFTPVGGYQGTVYFSCTGLPAGTACTFNPTSVTANGSDVVQSSILTVNTTAPYTGPVTVSGLMLLPGLALAGLVALRRRKLMPRLRMLMMLVAMACIFGGAIGCGSGNNVQATPVGSHVVTVSASATVSSGSGSSGSSSSTTHTANFTLVIH